MTSGMSPYGTCSPSSTSVTGYGARPAAPRPATTGSDIPAANTSTVLLGGTVNGGSVGQALLYPGQE